jgi:HlyD family secretion protein
MMRRTKQTIWTLVGLAFACGGCRQQADPTLIELNGRIEAPLVDIAPKVAGRVAEVRVREGDRVKAGDLLIRLDLGETAVAVKRDRSAVEAAEARLKDLAAGSRQAEIAAGGAEVSDRRAAVNLASRELERQQFLLSKKVGTDRDVDRAKTELTRARAALAAAENQLKLLREGARTHQVEQAEREVERARATLDQSRIVANESELRAPADGIVLHRMVEPGQLLGPSQPGLTLAFADRLYVRTFIPETKLGSVRQGQPAEVAVDAFQDRTFKATVSEISKDAEFTPKAVETRAERINLVYAAKVDLVQGWNAPLVPGQPAEVRIRIGEAPPAPR